MHGELHETGVRPAHPHAVDGALATVAAAVVDDPEDPPGRRVGLGAHHLFDEPAERFDAGGPLAAAEDPGPVDVPGGQVAEGATPVVLVLDAHVPGGGGASVGWQRWRAWIEVFSSAEITKSRFPRAFPSHVRA